MVARAQREGTTSECKATERQPDEESIILEHTDSDMQRMLAALLALVLIAVAAFSAIGVQRTGSQGSASERSLQG